MGPFVVPTRCDSWTNLYYAKERGMKMPKYKLFSNGRLGGTVTTEDVVGFIEKNYYPGIKYSVDEEKKEVFLQVDILKAMEFVNKMTNRR